MIPALYIGTAGWSLSRAQQPSFGDGPSLLARYATRFNAVEINSSFYRAHRQATYARWAESVPEDFRFSVKMPKAITHEKQLKAVTTLTKQFLLECKTLGHKLGPILVQLPPSLAFRKSTTENFMGKLRGRHDGSVVLEARHASWFKPDARKILEKFGVSAVIADPPKGGTPGQTGDIRYWRLHGSPRIYYSPYDLKSLMTFASDIKAASRTKHEAWCIFDNTTLGHATPNALKMQALLGKKK